MAISRFKTSTLAQGLPKYQDVWDGTTALFDSDFELIERTTVGSGGSLSVTFSSIPSTYRHLQVRAIWRDNRSNSGSGSYADLTFNSDTGNNYAYHQLYGTGSATGTAANSSVAAIELTRVADAGTTSGVFGTTILDILDYANTSKKTTVRALGGYDNNGGGSVYLYSGLWNNVSAVTSLRIQDSGGTLFSQYSSFALYGIKGAS